jgi:hypothetical protein
MRVNISGEQVVITIEKSDDITMALSLNKEKEEATLCLSLRDLCRLGDLAQNVRRMVVEVTGEFSLYKRRS